MILVGVAFFTLLERKILGYIHVRVGPDKVGYIGIFQPFRDAIKLFTKEGIKLYKLNYLVYYFSPLLGMFLCLILWLVPPIWGIFIFNVYGIIFFFCISSLMVYFLLGRGWSSSSKYSSVGSYRAAAQAISYEVSMILMLLGICWLINSLNFLWWNYGQVKISYLIIVLPIFVRWLIACLAESNRSPFDFSEGESELVSGFNTEYNGGLFSIIFITEYASILFLRVFTVYFFTMISIFNSLKVFLIAFYFVWVRGSFPRMRYDKLMIMAWKGILFYVLGILFYLFFVGRFF
jgi:NADH-ubiquinone oxidoreductase chain 1